MARREDGFTVVELMVAMMVMLIITVPLVASFVLGIRTTTESRQDVTNSADAQIVSAFFDIDVASATTASTASDAATCGAGAGRDVVLVLAWEDSGVDQVVSYVAVPNTATASQLGVANAFDLERVACGASDETVRVGRQLTAAPEVSCDGGDTCPDDTPRTVTMLSTAHSRLLADQPLSGTYTFSVTGTRRVSP